MALTRIFGSIGFIVRMIYKVTVQLAPFLSLYICLVWMFAIIMFTLGVKFDSKEDEAVQEVIEDSENIERFLKSGGHGGADGLWVSAETARRDTISTHMQHTADTEGLH